MNPFKIPEFKLDPKRVRRTITLSMHLSTQQNRRFLSVDISASSKKDQILSYPILLLLRVAY